MPSRSSPSHSATLRLETLLAHRDWVRGLARGVASDEHAADDVAQDAWVAAIQTPPREPGAARGWLRRVVRNVASNSRRSRARREARERRLDFGAAPATSHVVSEADAHRRVVCAVLALPEPQRSSVLLRFFHGLGWPEVGLRTGVRADTARARVRSALARLRAELDDPERGGRAAWMAALLPPEPGAMGPVSLATEVLVVTTKKKLLVAAVVLLATIGIGGRAGWFGAPTTPTVEEPPASSASEQPPSSVARSPEERPAERPPRHGETRERTQEAAPAGTRARDDGVRSLARGVVVDADGHPVAQAVVHADWGDGRERVVTDEGGAFDLLSTAELPPAYVWATAPGVVSRRARPDAGELQLVLEPGAALEVQVLDFDDTPAAGVTVAVSLVEPFEHLAASKPTDEAGVARFDGPLPVGAEIAVLAYTEGESPRRVMGFARIDAGGGRTQVRLARRSRTFVRVRFAGERGAVGGLDLVRRDGQRSLLRWSGGDATEMELPETAQRVRVVTAVGPSAWRVVDPASDTLDLVVPARTVRHVRLELGSASVAGATVMAWFGTDGTAAAGWIELDRLHRDGDAFVLPVARGGIYEILLGSGARVLTSESGDVVRLDAPQPRAPLRLDIVDADGRMPTDLRVVARGIGSQTEHGREPRTSDGQRVLDLVPGLAYRVMLAAPGHATVVRDVAIERDGGSLSLVLPRASSVRFRPPQPTTARFVIVRDLTADEPIEESDPGDGTFVAARGESGWLHVRVPGHSYVLGPGVPEEGVVELPEVRDVEVSWPLPSESAAGLRRTLFGLDATRGVRSLVRRHTPAAPMRVPLGRHLPVVWDGTSLTVHAPVTIDPHSTEIATSPPLADDAAWSVTRSPPGAVRTVFAIVQGAAGEPRELPIHTLRASEDATVRAHGTVVRIRARD